MWIAVLLAFVLFFFMARYLAKDENKHMTELENKRYLENPLPISINEIEVNTPKETYNFNVVGMKYRPISTKKFIDNLEGCEPVTLKPEPRNQYDKNAIKVLVYDDAKMKDTFIGYVPADEAIEIGQIINDNPCYKASVQNVFCDLDDDYFSISIEINH